MVGVSKHGNAVGLTSILDRGHFVHSSSLSLYSGHSANCLQQFVRPLSIVNNRSKLRRLPVPVWKACVRSELWSSSSSTSVENRCADAEAKRGDGRRRPAPLQPSRPQKDRRRETRKIISRIHSGQLPDPPFVDVSEVSLRRILHHRRTVESKRSE